MEMQMPNYPRFSTKMPLKMPSALAIPPELKAKTTREGSSKRQAMARAMKPAAKLISERVAAGLQK